MEDLFYEEAEGAAEFGDEEEEWEGLEAAEESDFGEEEEWEAGADAYLEEEFEEEGIEELDAFGEDYAFEGVEDAFEDMMAYALEAEDTDEFFRRIKRIASRIGGGLKRVGSVVGRVARVAAPIARLIPHPYARAASTALGLLGRLRAEGASEQEALEAFAELAMYDEAAIPIVGGLAARSLVRRAGARLPVQARRQLVRGMTAAAKTLTARKGPKAIRALPRIVASVRRTAAVRRTPVRALPQIVKRTVARVASSRPLAKKLSRPVPRAVRRVRIVANRVLPLASAAPRNFVVRGPVRISIAPWV
jgi:hypothetical protein